VRRASEVPPDPCLQRRGREKERRGRVKGFLPLKGEGGKDRRGNREEKVGEGKGQQQGGCRS